MFTCDLLPSSLVFPHVAKFAEILQRFDFLYCLLFFVACLLVIHTGICNITPPDGASERIDEEHRTEVQAEVGAC